MKSLESLKTAALLKALKEQGLTNRDIIDLAKVGDRGALEGLVK